MGVFFVYIFKSAVCLVLFYLFFRLFLSKETFHHFNRIALLGILCFSWIIPCIEVTTKQQIEVNQAVLTIEQLLLMAENTSSTITASASMPETPSVSWIQIVLLIYLAGILFFACRNIYSLGCLIKLLFYGKKERFEKGITLVVHDKEIAPFSWMKFIVISRKDLGENGREILIHERAHIRNRHSIDLLVADICIFFQWFNPGAWLLKQELQNIHEYEADEMVINEGVDAKKYQLLLIKKAVGTRLYSMANSFNHSKLKKRITMMLKEKSNPWARLKCLYVLPLAAVAVTAFARPEVSNTLEEASAVKVNDLAGIVEGNRVENDAMLIDTSKKTLTKVNLPAASRDSFHIVVSRAKIKASSRDSVSDKEKPVVAINGKESDYDLLNALDPSSIKDIAVSKSPENIEIYGNRSKNGVLHVQLYPKDKIQPQSPAIKENIRYRINALTGGMKMKDIGGGINVKANNEPMVIVDGKEVTGDKPLDQLPHGRIKSVSVLKKEAAIATYGEKGENGVILVDMFTEEEYQKHKKNPESLSYTAKYNNVLETALSKKQIDKPYINPHCSPFSRNFLISSRRFFEICF